MNSTSSLRLGIDLGSTSIGWCLLEIDRHNTNNRLVAIGSRIFPDGRDDKSKEPLAVKRRLSRGARRRRDRNLRAKTQLIRVLQSKELLPGNSDEIKELENLNPYMLRAKAAREKVSLYELGRLLLHIRQRRGFKSNRRLDRSVDDKEIQGMKLGIQALEQQMGNLTLGEFLWKQIELQSGKKTMMAGIRFRPEVMPNGKNSYDFYANREMYEREIQIIWEKQSQFYPGVLTPDLFQKLHRIIIDQRPLGKPKVGKCALLFKEGALRARLAYPMVQRFRILQECNNLNWEQYESGSEQLSQDERKLIADALSYKPAIKSNPCSSKHQLRFKSIRKHLLKKNHDLCFNLETDNREYLKADCTSAQLANEKCFGSRWFDLSYTEQNEIIDKIIDSEDERSLIEWLCETYTLPREHAQGVAEVRLVDGYGRISIEALARILPYIEEGKMYSEACELAGLNHSILPEKHLDNLPYYGLALPESVIGGSFDEEENPEACYGKINNPTVHMGLNQLRRVVNAIIKKYGMPSQIVVELARDLKLSEKQKKEIKKIQKKNQDHNNEIDEELNRLGIKPNGIDRMKYKLWEDLSPQPEHRCCPFCGKPISLDKLYSPEIEVEHLLPFSRTYDDSRSNKVVSCRTCNRLKANRSPYEAFHQSENWATIVSRADMLPDNKKWRFEKDAMERFEEDGAIARLLNDTRYMSRVAAKYLRCICDNVSVTPGQLTSLLRQKWGLNHLLGEEEKNRGDHRHHAIDAFVIACTTRKVLQEISCESARLTESNPDARHRLVEHMPEPFVGFEWSDLKRKIDAMIVSYKLDRGDVRKAACKGNTTGQLHEESNYGFIRNSDKKNYAIFAIRKPLLGGKWDEKTIALIADEHIRERLSDLYHKYDSDKKGWENCLLRFHEETNIRRLRIHVSKSLDAVSPICDEEGTPYRYVVNGSNYCADFIEHRHGKKAEKWECVVTTTLDAHKQYDVPSWKAKYPTAKKVMRLQIDDTVALDQDGYRKIYRVKKIRQNPSKVYLREHCVAREEKDTLSLSGSASFLKKNKARKVFVNELGEVFDPFEGNPDRQM